MLCSCGPQQRRALGLGAAPCACSSVPSVYQMMPATLGWHLSTPACLPLTRCTKEPTTTYVDAGAVECPQSGPSHEVGIRWRTALIVQRKLGAVGGEVEDAFGGLQAAAATAGATAPRRTYAGFMFGRA